MVKLSAECNKKDCPQLDSPGKLACLKWAYVSRDSTRNKRIAPTQVPSQPLWTAIKGCSK